MVVGCCGMAIADFMSLEVVWCGCGGCSIYDVVIFDSRSERVLSLDGLGFSSSLVMIIKSELTFFFFQRERHVVMWDGA